MNRKLVVIAAVTLVLLFGAPTAGADSGTGVSCLLGFCTVDGSSGSPSTPSSPGGSGSGCSWRGTQVPCSTSNGSFNGQSGCYERSVDPASVSGPARAEFEQSGGSIVFATCPFGGSGGYVWRPPAKPVVTAGLVLRELKRRLIPSAAVGLAPRAATLVNIQTVVWVDAPSARDLPVVPILGQRVSIHLVADHVVYDFGDGAGDDDGPIGKAYDQLGDPCRTRSCPDYYGHVYHARGQRTVTATVQWHASFTVDGGESVDIPGTVPGPAATAQLEVREARSVLVPNP